MLHDGIQTGRVLMPGQRGELIDAHAPAGCAIDFTAGLRRRRAWA